MAFSVRNAFRAGSSDSLDELRETIASLEAQVTSLYEEKEASGFTTGGGDSDGLVALYEQKVALSNRTVAELQTALASFEAQLDGLYAEREAHGDGSASDMAAALTSLEAQLHALYREREDSEFAAQLGTAETGTLLATIQSFEEQLASFYELQSTNAYGLAEANQMVQSLEPQIAALLDERNELVDALRAKEAELERSRSKAKDMVAALMEQAFA